MDLSTFDGLEQFKQGAFDIYPASLYIAFEKVIDRRGGKGKLFPLSLILTLIMLGKMAGQKKISGVIGWVKERVCELRKIFKLAKIFPRPFNL